VRGAVATYRGFHDEQADGTVDARKDGYTTMVSRYYDLVTDIYERGWGAADDEVLAVVGLASDQQMDMRVVGVPVLGGDPVGLSLEIAPEELAAAGRDYCAALESLGSQKIVFRKECRFDSDHPHHADIGGPEEQNNPRPLTSHFAKHSARKTVIVVGILGGRRCRPVRGLPWRKIF